MPVSGAQAPSVRAFKWRTGDRLVRSPREGQAPSPTKMLDWTPEPEAAIFEGGLESGDLRLVRDDSVDIADGEERE